VLDHLGLKKEVPRERPLPGRSYAAALRGETAPWDDTVFFEFENVRSVRTRHWRYIHRFPKGPHELYDLANDSGERRNLADRPEAVATRDRLQEQLDGFFRRYADPQYDLYHAGRSKVKRLSE